MARTTRKGKQADGEAASAGAAAALARVVALLPHSAEVLTSPFLGRAGAEFFRNETADAEAAAKAAAEKAAADDAAVHELRGRRAAEAAAKAAADKAAADRAVAAQSALTTPITFPSFHQPLLENFGITALNFVTKSRLS